VKTLAGVTGLPVLDLSADIGRICAPLAFIVPAYLMLVMGGVKALVAVWPRPYWRAELRLTQFYISNYWGPDLAAILAAIVSLVVLALLLRVWKPKGAEPATQHKHSFGNVCWHGRPI